MSPKLLVRESGSHHPGESGHANIVARRAVPSREKSETRLSRVLWEWDAAAERRAFLRTLRIARLRAVN
jgi:hypothetical protein